MTEAELHRSVAGFLKRALRPPAWFTTFPAGGGGYDRGKILSSNGMKSGVPDIFPIIFNGLVHGIELKRVSGKGLSNNQIRCHAELIECGCKIEICCSLDDVKGALNKWRIPWSAESKSSELLRLAIERWNSNHGNAQGGDDETMIDSHDEWRQLNERRKPK